MLPTISTRSELCAAVLAAVFLLARMRALVAPKIARSDERFLADTAHKRPLSRVHPFVLLHVTLLPEALVADRATERLGAAVNELLVCVHIGQRRKRLTTLIARVAMVVAVTALLVLLE